MRCNWEYIIIEEDTTKKSEILIWYQSFLLVAHDALVKQAMGCSSFRYAPAVHNLGVLGLATS